ncbi:hypothetical protein HN747_02415 [archaeon]|jgi:hypothetical protein|nr:hypothetical protein [archaeon]
MEIENVKKRFIVGFCQAATPFSAKCDLDSGLRLKAKSSFESEDMNFWDDGIAESFCYFGGGVLGLTCVPIDAIRVAFGNVRKTFKIAE